MLNYDIVSILEKGTIEECVSCKRITHVNCDGVCNECYEFHEKTRNNYRTIRTSKYKKQPIPEEIRWAVWERDNFTCRECGSRKRLTVDHIYPEVLGGETSMENCQTLCKKCNSKKGMKVL